MTELASIPNIGRSILCEEKEFLYKNENDNESSDTYFQEFDNTININDLRQFIRTSSFSKKHKTSSLIQDKVKTFENSTTPIKNSLVKSELLKNAPAKDEEVPFIREPVINPFLKAVSVNLNEEKEATKVFNKLEKNNKTKVSNYTFLIFNRAKKN